MKGSWANFVSICIMIIVISISYAVSKLQIDVLLTVIIGLLWGIFLQLGNLKNKWK